jgi:hypothetical protein
VTYNFQIEDNKIKLFMEYENITQKVLLSIESMLQNAKQLQHCAPFMAPPHGAHILEFLGMHFPGRWFSVDGPIPRHPRSPDTPLGFFLWGHFQDIVYKTPATSLDELRLRIVYVIETVTPEMLGNTRREIEYRLNILRATKDEHVEVV